jgi:hypothetical protein
MTTQINSIVRGSQFQAGTNYDERESILNALKVEHPESMIILFKGRQLKLTANWSLSGKTVNWVGEFPLDLYDELFGKFGIPEANPQASITIQPDLTVVVTTNSKFRGSKKKGFQYLDNSEIEIL